VNEFDWNVNRLSFLWDWLREQSIAGLTNCSSIRVFSHLNTNPISRSSEPRPVSPYGIAKMAGERSLSALFEGTGIPVTHLRPGPVFSCGEHPSQLASQLALSAFEGRRITLNAGHVTNPMYIDEAIDIIINTALQRRAGAVLPVAPSIPVVSVANLFEALSGARLNADYVDLAPGVPDPEFVADTKELQAEWTRRVDLASGLQRIIAEWIGAADSNTSSAAALGTGSLSRRGRRRAARH
jgi:nucleoside-diphosphate-sugar epimerase